MASYMPNTLSGFHPVTQALGGLAKAMFDPSYEIAGQAARQDADLSAARITELGASTGKLQAATRLDDQKFGGRNALESIIVNAFNPDGTMKPEARAGMLGALARGDQLGDADKVFSVNQAFALNPGDAGYEDELRRSLVLGGHMPDQNFAGTTARADQVSGRDATEALTQAVRVQGMQDATSITNNKLDNQTSIANNTADNVQSGVNNAADNAQRTSAGAKPLYTAFQDEAGNVYTFDTHAAAPTFTPALGANGQPLTNFNKIGTPGNGPDAKTYQVSPSQLLDFQDGIQTEAAGRELEPLQGDVLTTVQARAAELYSQPGATAGNAVGSIAQAFDELVQPEGGFSLGFDNAVLATQPTRAPAAPTMVAPPTPADVTEAQAAIARGADPVAVGQRFKQTFGVELQ